VHKCIHTSSAIVVAKNQLNSSIKTKIYIYIYIYIEREREREREREALALNKTKLALQKKKKKDYYGRFFSRRFLKPSRIKILQTVFLKNL
jgi:hypothetical protein